MLKHLAIIITGEQNSGKTTTLRHFCNTYYHKEVSTFKQGWRHGMSPFADYYYGVKITAYVLPSSRTEKQESLETIFNGLEWYPDFLFMAEQLNGAEYENTMRFLRENNYHIKEFRLEATNPDPVWHRYDPKDETVILTHRTEQIADYVRGFIKLRI